MFILKFIVAAFGVFGFYNTVAAVGERLERQLEEYEVAQRHPKGFIAFIVASSLSLVGLIAMAAMGLMP